MGQNLNLKNFLRGSLPLFPTWRQPCNHSPDEEWGRLLVLTTVSFTTAEDEAVLARSFWDICVSRGASPDPYVNSLCLYSLCFLRFSTHSSNHFIFLVYKVHVWQCMTWSWWKCDANPHKRLFHWFSGKHCVSQFFRVKNHKLDDSFYDRRAHNCSLD